MVPCFDGRQLTTCVNTAEVLPAKFESPPYTAIIACDPSDNIDVVNVACPPEFSTSVPSVDDPSLKVTVPAGMPVGVPATVALNVTAAPLLDGFGEELIAV